MQRGRTARFVAFALLGWAGLVVVGAAQALWPLPLLRGPDVPLLVVAFAALSPRASGHGAVGLAVLLGYLADLQSGAPKGLHAITLAVVALAARGIAPSLVVRGALSRMVTAALAATLGNAILLGARVVDADLGMAALRSRGLLPSVMSVLATTAFAPGVGWLMARLEAWLVRDPRLRP